MTLVRLGMLAVLLSTFSTSALAGGSTSPPAVGLCYDMSYAELFPSSYVEPPVSCAGTHTAKTVWSGLLPAEANYDDLASISSVVYAQCAPALQALLGQPLKATKKSAYGMGWFMPTEAQRGAGARWIRCDVILWKGTALQPLPTDVQPFLASSIVPKSVAACLAPKTLPMTTCNKAHVFRISATKTLSQVTYPGSSELARIAKKKCEPLVSTPAKFRVRYPDESAWTLAGDHVIQCFSAKTD